MLLRNRFQFSAMLLGGISLVYCCGCEAPKNPPTVAAPPIATPAEHSAGSTSPAKLPLTLIPRQRLFGNPEKIRARLSPNGKRLAYVAPVEGVLNVWVGPVDQPGEAKPVTNDTHRGVVNFFWAYTGEHLLYTQDKNGDEDAHVYCVHFHQR